MLIGASSSNRLVGILNSRSLEWPTAAQWRAGAGRVARERSAANHLKTGGNVSFIWTILIGFIVGLLARFLMPGDDKMGIIMTTILGIVGSIAATYVGQFMGWYVAGEGAGFIASLVGALVLLLVYNMVRKKTA